MIGVGISGPRGGSGGGTTVVGYERPSDWLDLPSIVATDQQFSALVAVWDAYGNPLTFKFTCDSGDYDVDWGDGKTETVTSGTWAEHFYDYADVDDLTTRGYRQAIVTVTPTTGGSVFTAVDLNQKHTALANGIRYSTPLLDIRMAGSSISSWTVRNINGNTGIFFDYLEQFEWVGANSITNGQYFFAYLRALKKVVALDTSNFTSFNQIHYDNWLLVETPTYDTSSANNLSSMFYLCYSIPVAKVTDMSGATTISSMFYRTYGLKTIEYTVPISSTCTVMNNAFRESGINLLPTDWDTSAVTTITDMFRSYYAQKSPSIVPAWDFSGVTTAPSSNTFNGRNMKRFLATGLTKTFTINYNLMGEDEINEMFTNLGDGGGTETVTVTNNPGAATCNTSIATAKNWTVVT